MRLNDFMKEFTYYWNVVIIENLPHHEKVIFDTNESRKYDSIDFVSYYISHIQFEPIESEFDDYNLVIRVYEL